MGCRGYERRRLVDIASMLMMMNTVDLGAFNKIFRELCR